MSLRPELLIEYPFLSSAVNLLNIPDFDEEKDDVLEKVKYLFETFPKVQSSLKDLFDDLFNKTEKISHPINDRNINNDFSNIALFKLSILFASSFLTPLLINGLSNLWAKDSFERFKHIDRNQEPSRIKISKDLGIEVHSLGNNERAILERQSKPSSILMEYSIPYTDYLVQSVKINDPYYKMVNKYVLNGNVYLIKEELAHLVREAIRQRILQSNNLEITEELLEKLKSISEFHAVYLHIETHLSQIKKSGFEDSNITGDITSDLFPPCMNVIINKSNQGVNLTHYERLAIAFFYLNTNHSIEETIDVFRTLPDFNESLTRYQVEFANGQGSLEKRYSMYGCEKMRSISICHAEDKVFGDSICANGVKRKNSPKAEPIKSPRDFIFWKKVEQKRNKSKN